MLVSAHLTYFRRLVNAHFWCAAFWPDWPWKYRIADPGQSLRDRTGHPYRVVSLSVPSCGEIAVGTCLVMSRVVSYVPRYRKYMSCLSNPNIRRAYLNCPVLKKRLSTAQKRFSDSAGVFFVVCPVSEVELRSPLVDFDGFDTARYRGCLGHRLAFVGQAFA